MVMRGSIPFGTMYCTLTQSYCTELGHALDDEQFALDFVRQSKGKMIPFERQRKRRS